MKKLLYRSRSIALAYDDEDEGYYVLIDCVQKPYGMSFTYREHRFYADPLEAWTDYSQTVDIMVRRRIRGGKTGEEL